MSDKAGSSKGKGKMDLNDDETQEQIPSAVSSQDLSIFYSDYDRYGRGESLEDYVRHQQMEMRVYEQRNKPFQITETSESSQKTTEACLEGFQIGDLALDVETEELKQPIKKRRSKRIKYSDDHQKETPDKTDNRTREQIPSSSPSVPSALAPGDLSSVYTDYDHHHEPANNPFQVSSEPSESPQEESEGDPEAFKIGDFETYSTDSDAEKDENLIFELKISDTNRLVIPYEMASDHFPPLVIHPNSEEILQLIDPLHHEWKMTLTYDDDAHTFIITQGWSLYLQHYLLKPSDSIKFFHPIHQVKFNHFYIQHEKNFGPVLFEVTIPWSNRLPIPYDLAAKYFKPSAALPPPHHLAESLLLLTDHLNMTWKMRYVCYEDEKAYIIIRGWEEYMGYYSLKCGDKIRLFERNPRLEGNSFMISHESGPVTLDSFLPPLCLRSNLLCELDLTKEDIKFHRLEMPGVEIPFQCRTKEMVKLTDEDRKDWYVIIVYQSSLREYMILDGWEVIVRDHELEAGDMVRFYVPACPDHGRHFLIESAIKKKGGSLKGKEIAK